MYSQLTLIGYLGRDPEMRFMANGTGVTSFSMATSRSYTSNGEKVEESTWWRVSVWGKQAEACNKYLHKGSPVLVVGRLKPDENGNPATFQRKDGTTGSSYEVTAASVKFLPSGGEGQFVVGDVEAGEIPF